MIKIDDEYELSNYESLGVVTLIHTLCINKKYKGYISRSSVIAAKDCFDCGKLTPINIVEKSKFILGEEECKNY